MAGRPDLMAGRKSLTVYAGMSRHRGERLHQREEHLVHDHRRRRLFPNSRANGVLIAQGGRFGGWSLYVKDGKPAFDYNFLGMKRFTVVVG